MDGVSKRIPINRDDVELALMKCDYDLAKTAKRLGVSYSTLRNRLIEYGINVKAEEFRTWRRWSQA